MVEGTLPDSDFVQTFIFHTEPERAILLLHKRIGAAAGEVDEVINPFFRWSSKYALRVVSSDYETE